jgi:hypothetical protein
LPQAQGFPANLVPAKTFKKQTFFETALNLNGQEVLRALDIFAGRHAIQQRSFAHILDDAPAVPTHDRQGPVAVLDQGGAAFHPITGIAIQDVVQTLDRRSVDMSADDSLTA